jgi:hypothetical protein
MIVFDGYIGAPPTSTVISASAGAKAEENAVPPSPARVMAAANALLRKDDMKFLLLDNCR